jgi:hypothetical protein
MRRDFERLEGDSTGAVEFDPRSADRAATVHP